MFSSPAAFPADASEQLEYSSLNPPIWSSYDPTFTPSSGVYLNNYWSEYYYAPAYYEQQNFADCYQPVYFNNVVYYGFYEYSVAIYYVPVFYYPVHATYTATYIHTPDVLSEYDDEHDISNVNDIGYEILENSAASFSSYGAQETCSEECTSFEFYFEESGEQLNNAPFKDDDDDKDDDDKDENKDDDSTSCSSDTKSKECSGDVDLDKDHALLDLCAAFMKNSLPDDDKNSSSSEEYFSSDEDSSSSDSDNDDFTALKRHGNFTDLQHLYDYPQSTSDTFPSHEVREVIAKDKSDVTSEVHAESGKSFMDMILASEKYLGIQDNLENTKLYRDHCFKLSLKKNPRRKEAVLLDVLPTLVEESSTLDDVTDESSVDDTYRTGHQELVSHNEHEPVIRKMKQPKRRFNAIRKWFSKTFCCCCTSKDPP